MQSPSTASSLVSSRSSSEMKGSIDAGRKASKKQDAMEKVLASINEDEYDSVGCNVAHKLRRMSENQKIYAEQLINNVLFYGIQNRLNESSHVALAARNLQQEYNLTRNDNFSNFYYNSELNTQSINPNQEHEDAATLKEYLHFK